jgi:hypothetical protein
MKNKNNKNNKKIMMITLGILLIIFLSLRYPRLSGIVNKTYYIIMITLFIILFFFLIKGILPIKLKEIKIKKLIDEIDYQKLKDFIDNELPNNTEYDFLTFDEVYSTCADIIYLHKSKLSHYTKIEFSLEEKELISTYKEKKDQDSKNICEYYNKCLEVIEIINKYYNSEGKLKNK